MNHFVMRLRVWTDRLVLLGKYNTERSWFQVNEISKTTNFLFEYHLDRFTDSSYGLWDCRVGYWLYIFIFRGLAWQCQGCLPRLGSPWPRYPCRIRTSGTPWAATCTRSHWLSASTRYCSSRSLSMDCRVCSYRRSDTTRLKSIRFYG